MYTFEGRIRYSETDDKQNLTLPGVINYLQDCTTFHSNDLGLGVEHMKAQAKAWILTYWQIVTNRYPKMGETIKVSTWATGFAGIYGTRNFQILDSEGDRIVSANSIWVFMDLEKGRPAKPSPEDIKMYGTEPELSMSYEPRKIEPAQDFVDQESVQVRRYHIDTNGHMNNCQYVQLALEVLEGDHSFGQVRVEYRKSAVYGDIVAPRVARDLQRAVVELCDTHGVPYAIVEFKGDMTCN